VALVALGALFAAGCTGDPQVPEPTAPPAPTASSGPMVVLEQLTPQLTADTSESGSVTIGREHRWGVVETPPYAREITFRVEQPGSRLAFAYALPPNGRSDHCEPAAHFEIELLEDGVALGDAPLFTTLTRGQAPWTAASASLAPFVGRELSARLRIVPLDDRGEDCPAIVGAWGDLRIEGPAAEQQPRPDIWLIVVDTLRADHLGYAGHPSVRTPAIDGLAARAHRFDDALSVAPWTRSSIFAMLAGDPYRAAAPYQDSFEDPFPDGYRSVLELAREQGYRSIGVNRNPILVPPCGFERGFDVLTPADDDPAIRDRLADLLSQHDPAQPKLVYLHLMAPHIPYEPHAEYTPHHLDAAGVAPELRHCPTLCQRQTELSEPQREACRACYRGEVEHADQAVGALLELLAASGQQERTWLFLTSDHGEELWDHGDFEHGHSLHRELLHVPLLIAPPGTPEESSLVRSDAPVSTVDLAHTIAEIVGLDPLPTHAGLSLLGAMAGEPLPAERPRLAGGMLYGPPRVALEGDGVKRIWTHSVHGAGPVTLEVFDRQRDPQERHPLELVQTDGAHPGGALWSHYARLLSTGSALLAARLPERTGQLTLTLRTEARVRLVEPSPGAGAALRSSGEDLVEILVEPGTPALLLQLDGLRERAPSVALSLSADGAALPADAMSWPEGSTHDGTWTRIPTPWGRLPTVRSPAPTGPSLNWMGANTGTHASVGQPEDVREQLEALGYVDGAP